MVESKNVEPADPEGRPYGAILHTGLEHLRGRWGP